MRSEFQFIRDIKERFSLARVGDDCAVLPKDDVSDLLVTADLLIENVDFRLNWAKPADIGHKTLAVSLSDIAAMGGTPTSAMLSLGVPEKLWKSSFLDEFYEGWQSLAKEFRVELIGGDVARSPDGLVIDSIVLGEIPRNKAIRRSGAKIGDSIFVSGSLGAAAAGLQLLESGDTNRESELVRKQIRPMPEVNLAKDLMALGIVSSMIDISDGIASDIRRICEASGVGATIAADRLPIHPEIINHFRDPNEALNMALNGGEDFELLFTAASDGEKFASFEVPITRIGEITTSGKVQLAFNGVAHEMPDRGYRHF